MAKKEEAVYSVPLSKIIGDRAFETVYLPDLPENIMISNAGINRPGLQFAGFYDHYEASRLQIIGKVEHLYLATLSPEERAKRLEAFYASRPVGVIYTSSLSIGEDARKFAEKYRVPILRSADLTSPLMAALIALLSTELAPRLTRHGVLVEVYGEGILLLGDSGIGKSETAIELVKRGHRLIADDAVDIRRV
ncbi:MAG: HPr kinase/phosphorylase, partial [Clostridia bacterium]|nr:HPr kinase/phosphorylase [Clostridia bacterium]